MCRVAATSPSPFNLKQTPTTDIYTLSLHDALPISGARLAHAHPAPAHRQDARRRPGPAPGADPDAAHPPGGERCVDRKSTRLNSSHVAISYAVFCLKKKKIQRYISHNRKLQ